MLGPRLHRDHRGARHVRTQIAYVAESGVGDGRTRRIALMDSDGYNHRYLTTGGAMV